MHIGYISVPNPKWGGANSGIHKSEIRSDSRLAHLSNPGAKKTDTNLSIIIKVRIKPPAALRQITEKRRNSRIDIRKLDIKEEESILVGSAVRALNKS